MKDPRSQSQHWLSSCPYKGKPSTMATVFRAPLYPTDLFTHPVLATTPTHGNSAGCWTVLFPHQVAVLKQKSLKITCLLEFRKLFCADRSLQRERSALSYLHCALRVAVLGVAVAVTARVLVVAPLGVVVVILLVILVIIIAVHLIVLHWFHTITWKKQSGNKLQIMQSNYEKAEVK